jgi:hypothetical protein
MVGLDKRFFELTHDVRRWIAAMVFLGWLIVMLNVAQIALVGQSLDRALFRLPQPARLLLAFGGIISIRAVLTFAGLIVAGLTGQT